MIKCIEDIICKAGYDNTFNPNNTLYLQREQIIIKDKIVFIIALNTLNKKEEILSLYDLLVSNNIIYVDLLVLGQIK